MRIPVSTYKVLLNPDFNFRSFQAVLPYLEELGITDLYVSPIFKARSGSRHGYDVVDFSRLNSELGSESEFEALALEVSRRGLGWIQDMVPNHMAFDSANPMLMEVLQNGEHSRYYGFFDIDWRHPYESIRGRLLSPFLGEFYGEALEKGEIRLEYDESGLAIRYYDHRFPLKLESYDRVLGPNLHTLRNRLGEEHPDYIKIHGLMSLAENQGGSEGGNWHERAQFIKSVLWELYHQNPEIREHVRKRLAFYNGTVGDPDSYNPLDNLLAEQLFRLSFWKVASEEINYRRFFQINDLISLSMEQESVFKHVHELVFRLIGEGKITGLRIDHIDGLYHPLEYLRRIRQAWPDLYVVVEKILTRDEEIPGSWPVQGTTGYDFLYYANELFCERKSRRSFDKVYGRVFGQEYHALVADKKREILERYMGGDVDNLAHLTKTVFSTYRHGGDLTLYALRDAITEVMAQFPVYRTYMDGEERRESDRAYIQRAVNQAVRHNPGLWYEMNFIEKFLLLQFTEYLQEEGRRPWVHFVMRFQQYTAPLTAKGVEDSAFYVYNRLLSLNEVGGCPDQFGLAPEEVHAFFVRRRQQHAHGLNATATHDTKRGEDARARLNVLSEIPQEWDYHFQTWSKLNGRKKIAVNNLRVPDKNDEYFFYQALLASYPFVEEELPEFIERLKQYIVKAVREAKVHTGWIKPDLDYENAFAAFVDRLLRSAPGQPFMKSFLAFQKKVAYFGIFNSLSQTLLKCAAPGVPDLYQGCELWDLSLVDPDNRRAVDFDQRFRLLREIQERSQPAGLASLLAEMLDAKADGRVKLFLLARCLQFRRMNPRIFQEGNYIPLESDGLFKENVFAFGRSAGNRWILAVLPRFLTALIREGQDPLGEEVWGNTVLNLPKGAPAGWRSVLTARELAANRSIPVGLLLEDFPVGLWEGIES